MKQNLLLKSYLIIFLFIQGIFAYTQETFEYTGEIVDYVVPDGVSNIRITAVGAAGGVGVTGEAGAAGDGASIAGDFIVVPGQTLKILVGEKGNDGGYVGAGGGGSFVWIDDTEELLIAAGGGGGGGRSSEFEDGLDAVLTEDATDGAGMPDGGGVDGNGATTPAVVAWAGGGTGWLTSGNDGSEHDCAVYCTGGVKPLLGGEGGSGGGDDDTAADGGFGGGGGNNGRCGSVGGGGGGGYSGGGSGGEAIGSQFNGGGGGGSYNGGTSPENIAGVGTEHGSVIIEVTCSALSLTVTDYDPCINEYITLSAESETGGITTWEDAVEDGVPFIPGAPGTYIYTVNSTGEDDCAGIVTINVRPFPTVVANATPSELCEGESLILYGGGAETYEWSPGDIEDRDVIYPEEGTHTYIATGTDEFGCVADDEVTVVVHPEPILVITADKTIICEGDEVTLTATGGVEYDWDSPVENGIPFTLDEIGSYTYEVEIEDINGCEAEGEITITVGAPIEITYTVTAEVMGDDGAIDIDVTGGTMPYTFDWDNDGTGDFDDSEDLTGIAGGDYVVVVKDAGTCSNTESMTIETQLGIETLKDLEVNVFPNPSNDHITIQVEGQFSYEFHAMNGSVLTLGNAINQTKLNLGDFETGVYYLTVKTKDASKLIKVVKN
ncbi:T9SS type A sorting domain-containing protein [Crocinitomix catalasitica]|uniref:T9SS type A sorting domain-containing protein n=1 Tax=Crocinitomix catalasitica TaxID=184607 RepID=UPI000487EDFC|nr:T9SS type A sorting domain-containing protein [Crocinitomix catalasitica]